ncbi:MAG: hypothetical protein DRO52_04590 [Candidatus Hecatellales archaeon]|nr:MAG: hypothetical protein DRO52_04590 [Candidatus Hecatellales archaeon]
MKAEYLSVEARTVLNRLRRRDEWYSCAYTVNPYRGCEFACPYCYDVAERWRGPYHARPEELSWKIFVKRNAAKKLREEIKGKKAGHRLLRLGHRPLPASRGKI